MFQSKYRWLQHMSGIMSSSLCLRFNRDWLRCWNDFLLHCFDAGCLADSDPQGFPQTPSAHIFWFQGSPEHSTPPKMPHLREYTLYLHHFASVKGKIWNGFLDHFRPGDRLSRRLHNKGAALIQYSLYLSHVIGNTAQWVKWNPPVTTLAETLDPSGLY